MGKYIKGDLITSLDELSRQEFIFHNHKVLHRGWFMSWGIRNTLDQIKRGNIWKAKKTED